MFRIIIIIAAESAYLTILPKIIYIPKILLFYISIENILIRIVI
jgi:hypothetical protein